MQYLLLSKLKSFVIGFASVNLFWYIAHYVVSKNVLPNPILVYRNIPSLISSQVFTHLSYSLFRIFLGVIIAMFLGLLIGIFCANNNLVSKILNPFIYFTYPIPKIALLPAIMLLFGLRETSKIIMIVLIIIYPVIITVRDAVRDIPKDVYHMFQCFGAEKITLFISVTLPCAFSSILSTIRIALGTAISILFFTEVYGTRYGMGFFIMDAWTRISYLEMYSGIVVLSLLGFIMFVAIDIIEDIFLKWKRI